MRKFTAAVCAVLISLSTPCSGETAPAARAAVSAELRPALDRYHATLDFAARLVPLKQSVNRALADNYDRIVELAIAQASPEEAVPPEHRALVVRVMRESKPEFMDVIAQCLDSVFTVDRYLSVSTRRIAAVMSAADLDAVTAFHRSELGQKLMRMQAEILVEMVNRAENFDADRGVDMLSAESKAELVNKFFTAEEQQRLGAFILTPAGRKFRRVEAATEAELSKDFDALCDPKIEPILQTLQDKIIQELDPQPSDETEASPL